MNVDVLVLFADIDWTDPDAAAICGFGNGAVGPMGNNNPFITLASGDAVAWDLEYVEAA